ncbi:carbohydrate kinase family protein [Patescibacteria group bacterium]|nr:carbohydrate kinase family protein [Patescibacteria group bacterium]
MTTEFISIGDTVVDEFIELQDARVHCKIDDEECEISMRWGDKIPFKSAVMVAGVGNAANAAVSAARLGLKTAFVTNTGKDAYGKEILNVFKKEKIDTKFVKLHAGIPTNHHYVLSFESERTILVKHEHYPYALPKLPKPKTIYLSSLGEGTEEYHDQVAAYAEAHPEVFFAFQPGTFQMKLGIEKLARIYKRADFVVVNKEEAERILGLSGPQDIKELLEKMRALGPKIALITDGRNGAYAYDGTKTFFVPMYPDVRAPKERTGAGDAFASTVAAALTLGKTLQEALLWGPVNSMSVVQDIGAQRGLLPRKALEEYLAKAPTEYAIKEI